MSPNHKTIETHSSRKGNCAHDERVANSVKLLEKGNDCIRRSKWCEEIAGEEVAFSRHSRSTFSITMPTWQERRAVSKQ
jgi:hypothetical protein